MQKADKIRMKRNVRTIWISDVHLGFPGCSADHLLRFIRDMRCETLYLVDEIELLRLADEPAVLKRMEPRRPEMAA